MGPKQKKCYDAIERFIKDNGYSPTFDELADILGYKNRASVHHHVRKLVDANMVYYEPNMKRALQLTKHRRNVGIMAR